MRRKIIAGNWKMYKTRAEALEFIYQVADKLPERSKVETVIFAPSLYARCLVKRQGNLRIGVQNIHYLDEGAYTGELSLKMVEPLGFEYVLIGHSERRQYFKESDKDVNLKLKKVLTSNLTPVVCVGENLLVRQKNEVYDYLANQIKSAFLVVSANDAKKVVIAYEPIWAIGTGETATPEVANQTIKGIREVIEKLYNKEVAAEIRILYGGSVKPENIKDILLTSEIDGALIGGASLDASKFLKIVDAAR